MRVLHPLTDFLFLPLFNPAEHFEGTRAGWYDEGDGCKNTSHMTERRGPTYIGSNGRVAAEI